MTDLSPIKQENHTKPIAALSTIILIVLLALSSGTMLTELDQQMAETKTNQINKNNPHEVELLNLFNKILYANSLENKNYSLHMLKLDNDTVSVAGMKLGRELVMQKDLIPLFKTEQGKAFILAHELAHSELQHNTNLITLFFTNSSDGYKTNKRNPFFVANLAKDKELEADAYAIKLLTNLYKEEDLKIEELTEMFKVLSILENKIELENGQIINRKEWQTLYSDKLEHPSDIARIEAITQLLDN